MDDPVSSPSVSVAHMPDGRWIVELDGDPGVPGWAAVLPEEERAERAARIVGELVTSGADPSDAEVQLLLVRLLR